MPYQNLKSLFGALWLSSRDFFSWQTICLMLVMFPRLGSAQVAFDGTFSQGELLGPNFHIAEAQGTRIGANLFHSFSEFSLSNGQSATFTGSNSVQNILSRVTGGAASYLDGALISQIPGANFFFMNPFGVIFGPGSSLDVSGDLTVTTADFIELADGARFNVLPGSEDQILTASPPSAFGFLSDQPSSIQFAGSQLSGSVAPGKSLNLIGGNVSVAQSLLAVPSVNVMITSVASRGKVTLNTKQPNAAPEINAAQLGKIEFRQSILDVSDGFWELSATPLTPVALPFGQGGGKIVIRGGKLQVAEGSVLSSISFSDQDGKGVDIATSDSLEILSSSFIVNATLGAGKGGNVDLKSKKILVDGEFKLSGIISNTIGDGDSGDMSITADVLQLQNIGGLASVSTGLGNSGALKVHAGKILMDQSGLLITNTFSRESGSGSAGKFEITTDSLSIRSGSILSSSTLGQGTGGDLKVRAGEVLIDGFNSEQSQSILRELMTQNNVPKPEEIPSDNNPSQDFLQVPRSLLALDSEAPLPAFTGIASETLSTQHDGRAGNIELEVERLRIQDGGRLSSNTFGMGDGGSIKVTAGQMVMDGRDRLVFDTGLLANTTMSQGGGKAGDIEVTANSLQILGRAGISSATFGSGDGSSVQINADEILIDGFFSGMNADTFAGHGGGDAGSIGITTGAMRIQNGAFVSSSTFGTGHGGTIKVEAETLSIDSLGIQSARNALFSLLEVQERSDGSSFANSVVFTDRSGAQQRVEIGRIEIDKEQAPFFSGLLVDTHSVEAGGDAGGIILIAGSLRIENGGGISSSSFGNGNGTLLDIQADDIFINGNNRADPVGIIAETFSKTGGGNGGDIRIKTERLELLNQNSLIAVSTAGSGDAGAIHLETGALKLDDGAQIASLSTFSGQAGSLSISSKSDIELENGAQLTVESAQGGAGQLFVKSGGNLFLDASEITASAKSNGGSIELSAKELVWLKNGSKINAQAQGDGGNVTVKDARFVLLEDSHITANAIQGRGGNILISAEGLFLNGDSSVTASSEFGVDGEVQIDSIFDLSNALLALPEALLSSEDQLQERCTVRLQTNSGSLIEVGAGGLPAASAPYLPFNHLLHLY